MGQDREPMHKSSQSEDGKFLFVVLLNNQSKENTLTMNVEIPQLVFDKNLRNYTEKIKMNAFGFKIIKIKL